MGGKPFPWRVSSKRSQDLKRAPPGSRVCAPRQQPLFPSTPTRNSAGPCCSPGEAGPSLQTVLLFQECQLNAKLAAPPLRCQAVPPGHLCPQHSCSSSDLSLSSTCSEYSSGSSNTWHNSKSLRKRVSSPRREPGEEVLWLASRWEGRRPWPGLCTYFVPAPCWELGALPLGVCTTQLWKG